VLSAVALGCLLGLRHACDPDHVIAVSAIAARLRRPYGAGWIALAWGLGHTVTILAVGATLMTLRLAIPPRVALSMELLVGLVLIALGANNLACLQRGDATAQHAAGNPAGGAAGLARRALGVGFVHGLAGSAGVALLALAAVRTPGAAVAYLAVFGLGTIAGMWVLSMGLSAPLAALGRVPGLQRYVVAGSGALSVAFGLYLVCEIAFVQILS
jgi:hypothetical protein